MRAFLVLGLWVLSLACSAVVRAQTEDDPNASTVIVPKTSALADTAPAPAVDNSAGGASTTGSLPLLMCRAPGTLAFTFDEGPNVDLTPQYLDILAKKNVPATFFVVGKNINSKTAPIIQRMVRDGHLIGHGSWSYTSFLNMSDDQVKYEISSTASAIEGIISARPRFFRFPFGEYTTSQLDYVTQQELTAVDYSLDTGDNQLMGPDAGDRLFIKYQQRLSPRSADKHYIAIARDDYNVTLSQFEAIIDLALQRGYMFVRMDDCMDLNATQLADVKLNGGIGQSAPVIELNSTSDATRPFYHHTTSVSSFLSAAALACLVAMMLL